VSKQLFKEAKGTKTYAGAVKRVETAIANVQELEESIHTTIGNYRWVITAREDGTFFPAVLIPEDKTEWMHNFIEKNVGVMR
jgi:hypothetical protein